jgi:16S rRNA (uracil1498-N3)-methyltransferase
VTRALFYVDALPGVGELAVVDGDEGFHAANVRRIRPGEELDLGDGDGTVAHCVVEDVAKGRLTARVLDRTIIPLASPKVTVVQALPKSDRSELAIELATEAGADAFVAWQASVGRGGPVRGAPVAAPLHPLDRRCGVDGRVGAAGA